MYVAVSGISRTLTRAQRAVVTTTLDMQVAPEDTLVTGGAYGVDTAATIWAASEGIAVALYVPRDLLWNRRLAEIAGVEVVAEVPGTYMDRNDALADSSATKLVAFPDTKRTVLRSGTWATVRRFRARDKDVLVRALSQYK